MSLKTTINLMPLRVIKLTLTVITIFINYSKISSNDINFIMLRLLIAIDIVCNDARDDFFYHA